MCSISLDNRNAVDLCEDLKGLCIEYKRLARDPAGDVSRAEFVELYALANTFLICQRSIRSKTSSIVGSRSELRKVLKVLKRLYYWLNVSFRKR